MTYIVPAKIANSQSNCGICNVDYPQSEMLRHFMWHIARGDDTLIGTVQDDTSI